MAEIAFVIDMSGVCRSRETRRITPSPMTEARTNTYSVGQKSISHRRAGPSDRPYGSQLSAFSCQQFNSALGLLLLQRTPCPGVRHVAVVCDERAALDVVVQIHVECPVLREREHEC